MTYTGAHNRKKVPRLIWNQAASLEPSFLRNFLEWTASQFDSEIIVSNSGQRASNEQTDIRVFFIVASVCDK